MIDDNEISVTVKFFANLRSIAPPKKIVSLPSGSKVRTVLEMFNIPKDANLIILINGAPHQKKDTVVNNGDIVAIFPPLAGG